MSTRTQARFRPDGPGFYWAKLVRASPGTRDAEDALSVEFEVVDVFVNDFDPASNEHLRVFVPGVERSQSLDNFEWLAGPLTPPAAGPAGPEAKR